MHEDTQLVLVLLHLLAFSAPAGARSTPPTSSTVVPSRCATAVAAACESTPSYVAGASARARTTTTTTTTITTLTTTTRTTTPRATGSPTETYDLCASYCCAGAARARGVPPGPPRAPHSGGRQLRASQGVDYSSWTWLLVGSAPAGRMWACGIIRALILVRAGSAWPGMPTNFSTAPHHKYKTTDTMNDVLRAADPARAPLGAVRAVES